MFRYLTIYVFSNINLNNNSYKCFTHDHSIMLQCFFVCVANSQIEYCKNTLTTISDVCSIHLRLQHKGRSIWEHFRMFLFVAVDNWSLYACCRLLLLLQLLLLLLNAICTNYIVNMFTGGNKGVKYWLYVENTL